MQRFSVVITVLIFGALCAFANGVPNGSEPVGGNILLLVADDLGMDKIGIYGEHPGAPNTPNIDALAARGVRFRNAYAPPSCSPARASILTGRYGRRIGLGAWIRMGTFAFEVPPATLMIPGMLDRYSPLKYDHALVGKWHLAGFRSSPDLDHPRKLGFRRFSGSAGNLKASSQQDGEVRGYYHWQKVTDGVASFVDEYATTVSVDDALAYIDEMSKPWFLMVAFNAAHPPLDIPPAELHSRSDEELEDSIGKYDAMVEALDAEIGRLLSGIDPEVLADTTVIFMSDGGTLRSGTAPPLNPKHAKQTIYEGGTNIPLIVAGPPVSAPGSESDALVHVVDIFPTIADIAGVHPDQLLDPNGKRLVLDGHTLLPFVRDPRLPSEREYLYTELFRGPGKPPYYFDARAVRDRRFKLIRRLSQPDELYDLQGRFDDGPNLLEAALNAEAQAAYQRLSLELERLEKELTYDGF